MKKTILYVVFEKCIQFLLKIVLQIKKLRLRFKKG